MKRVLLINPNGSEKTTQSMTEIANRYLPNVFGWTNRNGPNMIIDKAGLNTASHQIAKTNWQNVSAIIVAAFGDPGVELLANHMDVPIIGIGAAAARAASQGGASFAVVTTTPKLTDEINKLMLKKGGSSYLGSYLTKVEPTTLVSNPNTLDKALIKACKVAEYDGAERIIIGGGPLAEAALRISSKVAVPLVHPLYEACCEIKTLI